jgi:raffinose/stachyose/melibiose transport system substrate-binding protein
MYNHRKLSLVILAAVLLVLSACAPVAAPASAPAEEGAAASSEAAELLLWHSFDSQARAGALETLVANFEAANPNVDVTIEFQDFENMKTIVKTALASGTGPDLVFYGPGAGFMGPLVESDLLLPLDEYSEQYGWAERIYPWTFESTSFDDTLYALGHELEFIGVYYNTAIFEELGVSEPTTYEELLEIGEKAKAAGYIPFAFPNQPGWPAFHVFSAFANNLAGKEGMEDVLFGDGSWTAPEFVRAIQLPFVELNQAGFFPPSLNALTYDDGNALFYTGQAAMHLTGTWLVSAILENVQDFETSFFALPSIDGSVVLPPGGMGSAAMISAATEHPDEAAALLDSLFTTEAAKIWIEQGQAIPPVDVDPTGFEVPGLFQFVIDTVRANSTEGGLGLGYNIDVLTPPEFNTAMLDGFQAVLEGNLTPEEQAEALQAAKEAAAQ